MALQKTFICIDTGLQLANSYCRITRVLYNTDNIDAHISTYVSREERVSGKQALNVVAYSVPYTDDGVTLPALYTYLKTLPEFVGAIDA